MLNDTKVYRLKHAHRAGTEAVEHEPQSPLAGNTGASCKPRIQFIRRISEWPMYAFIRHSAIAPWLMKPIAKSTLGWPGEAREGRD